MIISAGGFDVTKHADSYSFKDSNRSGSNVNITEVLQKKSQNVNSVSIWITRDWEESWYDAKSTQKNIIDKGYTPMFMFYFFADEINPKFILKNKK